MATPPPTDPVTSARAVASAYTTKDLLRAVLPALVAIILAIATRQVLPALSIGILVAGALMSTAGGDYNPIHWVTFAIDRYLFQSLAHIEKGSAEINYQHLKVLIFTFFIGAMVGVIEANGGTRAMVAKVTGRVTSRKTGQAGAFAAGLAVFFDDYANCMIIGPSMRPMFDRLRISRAKLAYILDSTAAADSSIFISTWLAAEISYLNEGFKALGSHVPAFLQGMDGSTTFWASIPYRMYPILALVMVFLVAVTGRDFGSMKKAEAEALRRGDPGEADAGGAAQDSGARWWLAALPVLVLLVLTLGLLVYTGWRNAADAHTVLQWNGLAAVWESVKTVLGKADSYLALVYGSLTAAVVAVVISWASRAITLAKAMDGVVSGMSRMFAACIVLVLAWGLSSAGSDLHLGESARTFLQEQVNRGTFSVALLPLAVFLTACFISFSTGTSWGTMGILCPAVIPIAAGLLEGYPPDEAKLLFYATVGAVLGGAVFGDHCSPISDTTVLSAIASDCELSLHVWTQMPYAITVAIAGVVCTDGLAYALGHWAPSFYGAYRPLSWAYGLTGGTLILLLVLLIFGRQPRITAAPDATQAVA